MIKEQHTYSLYNGSKKWECPRCHKRRFVPYVDKDGNMLSPEVGCCDRECECQYHYTPRQYFEDNCSLSRGRKMYRRECVTRTVKPTEAEREPCVLDVDPLRWLQDKSGMPAYLNNGLAAYLLRVYSERTLPLIEAFNRYKLGTTKDGAAVFWQIDERQRVRTGGIIHYGADGHRVKDGAHSGKRWAHKLLTLPGGWTLTQCLFGLHLLWHHFADGWPVFLVESEKTAIVMATEQPCAVWLATGGCGNFNERMLRPLRGIPVTVCPDNDEAFDKWEATAAPLNAKGWKLRIRPDLRRTYALHECKHGADLADVFISQQIAEQRTGRYSNLTDDITMSDEPF